MMPEAQQAAKAMPAVYTVSQVVAMVKGCLERTFAFIDIEAEISNWRQYPSGHAYFALKDAGAQLNAVLFAGVPCDCRASLGDGRRVKVRGQVTMYPQRGECQFKVLRIRLAGEGELMAQFLALRAKLASEGLFAQTRKRRLPRIPRRIGLVTSPAGAVVHDMCRVLLRRFPNISITIFPALVQGADAPASIVAALGRAASAALDLVIVARGGGSFEDLFCFNDEQVVRTVAAFPVPVISAVGHETDYTLCDFAADLRAGTPSIAAEIAVPVMADIMERLDAMSRRLVVLLQGAGEMAGQHLDRLSSSIAGALRSRLASTGAELAAAERTLASALRAGLAAASARLDAIAAALPRAAAIASERASQRLTAADAKLSLLSPYAVLDRGYSLTTDAAGNIVRDASTLSKGDTISTRFAVGSVTSTVQ